jgi:hypothetical protein
MEKVTWRSYAEAHYGEYVSLPDAGLVEHLRMLEAGEPVFCSGSCRTDDPGGPLWKDGDIVDTEKAT